MYSTYSALNHGMKPEPRSATRHNLARKRRAEGIMDNLPVELLQQIFLATCPSIDVNDPQSFVGRLSAVCRKWRETIVNSPELWCDFDISFGPKAEDTRWISSTTNYLPTSLNLLVDLCLHRSRERLLCFTFKPKKCYRCILSVMTRLLKHSNRWRDANLDSSLITTYCRSIFPLPQSFNALEALTLTSPSTFDFSCKPPNVHKLELTRFDLVHPSQLNVPWTRITELKLDIGTARGHLLSPFCKATTNLQRLTVVMSHSSGLPGLIKRYGVLGMNDATVVNLPFLTSLTLLTFPPEFPPEIRAPNLTDLCVDSWFVAYVAPLLERCGNVLHGLRLLGMEKEDTLRVLNMDNIRFIRRLHMDGGNETWDVLRRLRRFPGGSGDILPKLESIRLSTLTWINPEADMDALVQFIAARLAVSATDDHVANDYRFLKWVILEDTWMPKRLVEELLEEMPQIPFSWQYGDSDCGRPGIVTITFPS
ncbi:hypothetical protein FA15DRAFT_664085 [Coprinopsis marcescibilis]|uniref:F-box domain-containing protein n=1 Tax=Coprinopsis marcescibilis TaxID=230819 RepID=A0A5C3L9U8_COPMA|nr:hypothetical protein FA15DRAFT_664085 [Coprinopsis marcescibilis]